MGNTVNDATIINRSIFMVDVLEKVEEVKLFINGKEVKSQSQNLLNSIKR